MRIIDPYHPSWTYNYQLLTNISFSAIYIYSFLFSYFLLDIKKLTSRIIFDLYDDETELFLLQRITKTYPSVHFKGGVQCLFIEEKRMDYRRRFKNPVMLENLNSRRGTFLKFITPREQNFDFIASPVLAPSFSPRLPFLESHYIYNPRAY